MKRPYEVCIVATVKKWITVDAHHEDEAVELAHQLFTVEPDEDGKEKYQQEAEGVRLL